MSGTYDLVLAETEIPDRMQPYLCIERINIGLRAGDGRRDDLRHHDRGIRPGGDELVHKSSVFLGSRIGIRDAIEVVRAGVQQDISRSQVRDGRCRTRYLIYRPP